MNAQSSRSLEGQRLEFSQSRFLAMPVSGTIAWTVIGILSGIMWLPFSWIIRHWIGTFHAFARTALVTIAWFVFPDQRFVVIPAIIVAIYLITIYVLARRPRPGK